MLRKPVSDPVGPWTTYGPKPPPLGTNYSSDDWGDGENCLFQVVNGQQVPRLPDLSAGDRPGALVPIPYNQLNDGPWCPGATNDKGDTLPNRYDADMLRVRKIRVTLRVQVAPDSLRGRESERADALHEPGHRERRATPTCRTRKSGSRSRPRNMNIGR